MDLNELISTPMAPTEYKNYVAHLHEEYVDARSLMGIIADFHPSLKDQFNTQQNSWSVEFKIKDQTYLIEQSHIQGQHRYGDGGECEDTTTLKLTQPGVPHPRTLLLCRNFVKYDTYSDDSTDYSGPGLKDVYLTEKEPLAIRVFSALVDRLG